MSLLTRDDRHPAAPKTAVEAWKLLEELRDGDHIGIPMWRVESAWTIALLDLRDRLSS